MYFQVFFSSTDKEALAHKAKSITPPQGKLTDHVGLPDSCHVTKPVHPGFYALNQGCSYIVTMAKGKVSVIVAYEMKTNLV